MATIPARFAPFILDDTYVRQDEHGRYSLNDLHEAAGGERRHQPANWLQNKQTKELVAELETKAGIPALTPGIPGFEARKGNQGGTYVARELVYAYAMWISPAFHLKVIQTFDAVMTGKPVGRTGAEVMAGDVPLSALVVAQQQSWRLMDRIKAEQSGPVRAHLYAQLAAVLRVLGKTPPPLTALGYEAPSVPPAVTEFWQAVEAMTAAGVPINHSRAPGLYALRLGDVYETAKAMGLKVALPPVLRRVMRLSRSPRFVASKVVNSAVELRSVQCWVFERVEGGV